MSKKITKKIICGNWKMNPLTSKEAEKLFSDVAKGISGIKTMRKTEIVICPPFIYLERLKKIRTSKIKLGAQDAFGGDVGAFTGEVSGEMLAGVGASYVILGHSERRSPPVGEGETNEVINKKIKAALSAGLVPILCVGEDVRDLDHSYFNLVKTQIEECLAGVSKNLIPKIIIAYEPVWALSSTANRKDATSADSKEMAIFIRKVLFDKFGRDASSARIIYGGSANEKSTEDFLKNGGVDGLLPGRASLNAKKFVEIVKICEALNQ